MCAPPIRLQKAVIIDDGCALIKIPECVRRVRKWGMACDAVVRRVASSLGFEYLSPHQLDVVKAFATGRDVFIPLPTCSGKSSLASQTLVNPICEGLARETS